MSDAFDLIVSRYVSIRDLPDISTAGVHVELKLSVPFVPFNGLVIWAPGGAELHLRDVTWDVEENAFRASDGSEEIEYRQLFLSSVARIVKEGFSLQIYDGFGDYVNADGYLGVIRLDGIELQCGELECAFLIAENREFETIKPFVPYSEQKART